MSCLYKSRHRNTAQLLNLRRWFVYGLSDPYYQDFWDFPVGKYSTIDDVVVDYKTMKLTPKLYSCPSFSKRPKVFKPVHHVSLVADDSATSYGYGSWITSGRNMTEHFPIGLYQQRVISSIGSSTFDVVISDFTNEQISKAFGELIPGLEDAKVNGINLYTFILELADLKKLFSKSIITFKKSFSTIPEKHLAINFGILPFWSDMVALYDIYDKLNAYIDKWNDAAKNGVVFDKHRLIGGIDYDVPIVKNAIMLSSSMIRTNVTGTLHKNASARCHLYYKPRVISDSQRKQVFYRALGLGRPLVGVWEAVPFSWAIDYFYNIGEIISRYDEAVENMFKFDFVDAGYSIKGSVKGSYHATSYCASSACRVPYSGFSQNVDASIYNRQRLPFSTVVEYSQLRPEVTFGWKSGARQASYLAAVAYLKAHK